MSARYQVESTLAEGGMARVLLATQRGAGGFEKRVVLKRVLPHLAHNRRFGEMFLDEARIAADLRHPNVVMLLDAGRDEDDLYIALEFLDGVDVATILRAYKNRGERVPLGAALAIVADAAHGLAYVHEKTNLAGEPLGIVHRDVSPSNLFVTSSGHTKVLDFGIAHARCQVTITEAGVLKGKCAYMSPEHVLGDPLDGRSDQFALGVVLWELTVGSYLFWAGNDVDTLARVLACDVPKPSSLIPHYPAALERIVMKALAPAPSDRFASCAELADELEEAMVKLGLMGGRETRACVRVARATLATASPMERTRVELKGRPLLPDANADHVGASTMSERRGAERTSVESAAVPDRAGRADLVRIARSMLAESDPTLDAVRFATIGTQAHAAARVMVIEAEADVLPLAVVAEIALAPPDGRLLLERGLALAEDARASRSALADPALLARAYELLGDREKARGEVELARAAYARALECAGDARPSEVGTGGVLAAIIARNLADLELQAGDLVAGEKHARVACRAARIAESRVALARATLTLARIALVRGELDEAELLLERAGRVFVEEADARFAARVQFERARVCEARGDFDLAAQLLENAFDAHVACHDGVFAARAKEALGLVCAFRLDAAAASAHLADARARAESLGDVGAAARITERLSQLA